MHCPVPGVQGAGLSCLQFPGRHTWTMVLGRRCQPEGSAQVQRREPQTGVEGIPEQLGRQPASGAPGPEVVWRSRPFSTGSVQGRQEGPGGVGPGSL